MVEQNAAIALKNAQDGYIMELGRIVAAGSCDELAQKQDVQGILPRRRHRGTKSGGAQAALEKAKDMAVAALADTAPRTPARAIVVEGHDTPTRLFRARCLAWSDPTGAAPEAQGHLAFDDLARVLRKCPRCRVGAA